MLHLYLIRHAEAVTHGDPNYEDDDRPLTELGHRQSRALGKALGAQAVRFDVILCSPLPRARETVEGMLVNLPGPTPPVEYADELAPGLKPKKVDRLVLKHEGEAIALVGHEPDLGEYAARLIGSKKATVELAKGGVAGVACADPPGKGCGSLVWLITPPWFGVEG
jgi:phosphohistidine phosphatase